jgi:predicted O-methyltransferase YrrM
MMTSRLKNLARGCRESARKLSRRLKGGRFFRWSYPNPSLSEALRDPHKRSDISDHLSSIFFFALDAPAGLFVELGTRGGESTRALLAAAKLRSGRLLSVDIDPCSPADLPHRELWTFIQSDDISFGKERFKPWCRENQLPEEISLLFIDTSHEYEHTRAELSVWIPLLKPGGIVILHDTNMGDGTYGRSDGTTGIGWDNQRGVIRAVEEMQERSYDENTAFTDVTERFLVWHTPYCNGMTVLKIR